MRTNPTCKRQADAAPGYAATLLAYTAGIGAVVILGVVVYRAAPTPTRRAIRGQVEEPVARRSTWCSTPEQRSSYPVPRPDGEPSFDPEVGSAIPDSPPASEAAAVPEPYTLTPSDVPISPDPRLMLRLHAIADEMAAERAEAPAEWRWKADRTRLHLAELIRDLERGRLGEP